MSRGAERPVTGLQPETCIGVLWIPFWAWLLPRYLLLDPMAMPIAQAVSLVSGAVGALAVLGLRPTRRLWAVATGDLTPLPPDKPSRVALDLGYCATFAAAGCFLALARTPRVPYLDAFSLFCVQVATGVAVGLLGFFLASRRAHARTALGAALDRAEARPGLPAVFFGTTATLAFVSVTMLGVGSVRRAEGARRETLQQQTVALADLGSAALRQLRVDDPLAREQVLQTLTTHGEVEAALLPLSQRPASLGEDALFVERVDDAWYSVDMLGRRFAVDRTVGEERLWLVALASRPPAVRAPDDAPALLLLGLLALGAPLGAWLVGAELSAQLRALGAALRRLGTHEGPPTTLALAAPGVPVGSHDELGDLALEVQAALTVRDAENRRLSAELDGAAEADRARARFLASASHELRTPLNTISGYCHLLGRTPLSEAQREDVALIESASAQLLRHVDEILDLSSIESGRDAPLELAPVDVAALVESVLAALARAVPHGVEVGFRPAPGMPAIEGDTNRLRQVFENVIGNALKFTRAGWVHVSVSASPTHVIVQVADSGPGIPRADLDRIFDEFHRVESERSVAGTGLGLSIARRFVRQHGGRIEVESIEGEGSTFRVALPRGASKGGAS
ncbi:MAG: sensor histidine kinase [Bradymonadia bacterium]